MLAGGIGFAKSFYESGKMDRLHHRIGARLIARLIDGLREGRNGGSAPAGTDACFRDPRAVEQRPFVE